MAMPAIRTRHEIPENYLLQYAPPTCIQEATLEAGGILGGGCSVDIDSEPDVGYLDRLDVVMEKFFTH